MDFNGGFKASRALHDPSRGIRLLSSEPIGYFLIYKLIFIHLSTTNARLALRCTSLLADVGKVPVFTKKVKSPSQTTMWDDFKVGGENEMEFLNEVQRRRTNRVWSFQLDYVMCEDVHHRARASQAFVVKEWINMNYFQKITDCFARKDSYYSALTLHFWPWDHWPPLKSTIWRKILKNVISLRLKTDRHEHLAVNYQGVLFWKWTYPLMCFHTEGTFP